MRRLCVSVFALLCYCSMTVFAAPKTLDVYFIDVEGGQATLLVTPSGQSLLIDTGWPGFSMRDANRIAAAAKKAGVKAIDYVVITHFHTDHGGGVPQLIQKLPVKQFIDHGENREEDKSAKQVYEKYIEAVEASKRRTVHPGDKLAMKDLDVTVVTADGENYKSKLDQKDRQHENKNCASADQGKEDNTENARSVGLLIDFGKFRMVDFGDLTWANEMKLACPDLPIDNVGLFVVTHHGFNVSNSPALVKGLQAKVAIVDNGAHKGGTVQAYQTVRDSGVKDIWQLHYAMDAGKENNAQDPYLANLEEVCTGNYIKVSANRDGTFSVYNSRNKYEKSY